MKTYTSAGWLAFILTSTRQAPRRPRVRAAVNSASYDGLITQGSIFTVFAENLGPPAPNSAGGVLPLPFQVGGLRCA
jgi:hypothetical protein